MDKIKRGIQNYKSKLTAEDKRRISEKASKLQKEMKEKDPVKYSESKRIGGLASAKNNNKNRYTMNKIEKIIDKEFKKRKLKFEYSVILNYKQFDFGNKKNRILLEIQGDYWHGNPKFFGKAKEKRQLNEVQKNKQLKDIEKEAFAKKYGFMLFKIWEDDIHNGNYKKTIDKIEKIIKGK